MTPEDVGSVIASVGLISQIGGALLLAVLFAALLRGHPRQQPFFRIWTRGWVCLLAALIGVLVQYTFPALLETESAAVRAANVLYQVGKLLFVLHLAAGTLNYVRGVPPARLLRPGIPFAIGYGLLTAVLPGVLLNGLLVLQAPLVTLPFAACAWLLLTMPPSRRTLGSRATGVVFAIIAGLWVGYALAFAVEGLTWLADPDGPLTFLLRYNSYLDLLLQMLLGYGMVVLLLEDAKRETDDARAQLALAHDQLQRDALYDALTGTLNRRAFDAGVGMEAVGTRFGTALVLDLDNLKVVNDAHGHAAGDALLRRLADVLRAAAQPMDRVYRLGGDEFLVLSAQTLPEEAAANLRGALDGAAASNAASPALQVSIGAAPFTGREAIPAAIERADRAMYEDKARNRAGRIEAPPAAAPRPAVEGRRLR